MQTTSETSRFNIAPLRIQARWGAVCWQKKNWQFKSCTYKRCRGKYNRTINFANSRWKPNGHSPHPMQCFAWSFSCTHPRWKPKCLLADPLHPHPYLHMPLIISRTPSPRQPGRPLFSNGNIRKENRSGWLACRRRGGDTLSDGDFIKYFWGIRGAGLFWWGMFILSFSVSKAKWLVRREIATLLFYLCWFWGGNFLSCASFWGKIKHYWASWATKKNGISPSNINLKVFRTKVALPEV